MSVLTQNASIITVSAPGTNYTSTAYVTDAVSLSNAFLRIYLLLSDDNNAYIYPNLRPKCGMSSPSRSRTQLANWRALFRRNLEWSSEVQSFSGRLPGSVLLFSTSLLPSLVGGSPTFMGTDFNPVYCISQLHPAWEHINAVCFVSASVLGHKLWMTNPNHRTAAASTVTINQNASAVYITQPTYITVTAPGANLTRTQTITTAGPVVTSFQTVQGPNQTATM